MKPDKKPTLHDARRARDHLLAVGSAALNGVGIAVKNGVFGLVVNVSNGQVRDSIPAQVKGVPVHRVSLVKSIQALSKRS